MNMEQEKQSGDHQPVVHVTESRVPFITHRYPTSHDFYVREVGAEGRHQVKMGDDRLDYGSHRFLVEASGKQ